MILSAAYLILFSWSVWCIISHKVKDGVLGRLFYSAIAIAAFAAVFSSHQFTIDRSNQLLVLAVALMGLRHFLIKMFNSRKPRP